MQTNICIQLWDDIGSVNLGPAQLWWVLGETDKKEKQAQELIKA